MKIFIGIERCSFTHLSNIDFSDGFVGTGRLTRSHCWELNTQQTSKLPTSEDIYSDHRMWKGQRGRPGGLKGLRKRGMERESKEGRKRPIGRENAKQRISNGSKQRQTTRRCGMEQRRNRESNANGEQREGGSQGEKVGVVVVGARRARGKRESWWWSCFRPAPETKRVLIPSHPSHRRRSFFVCLFFCMKMSQMFSN